MKAELKAMKRFFNRAVELSYLKENPARKVRQLSRARKKARFFGDGKIALILEDGEDTWAREFHVFLLNSGLRIGEAQNLKCGDVDFKGRRILVRPMTFWKPKRKKERAIPRYEVVYRLLMDRERQGRWVFTKQDGGRLNIHSLEAKFHHHLTRLAIQNANPTPGGTRSPAI